MIQPENWILYSVFSFCSESTGEGYLWVSLRVREYINAFKILLRKIPLTRWGGGCVDQRPMENPSCEIVRSNSVRERTSPLKCPPIASVRPCDMLQSQGVRKNSQHTSWIRSLGTALSVKNSSDASLLTSVTLAWHLENRPLLP